MSSGLKKKITYNAKVHTGNWGLPPQMIPQAQKEKDDWKQACMDYFDYQSSNQSAQKYKNAKKLEYLSGNIDLNSYKLSAQKKLGVLTAKQQKEELADFVHYPIMIRPLNTIIGEYIKRISQLHGFYVKNESEYGHNEYNRVKTEMLINWAQQKVMQRVQAKVKSMGLTEGTDQYNQAVQDQTPEDIQDYMDRDYNDIVVTVNNILLKNMWKRESLDSEFIEGFKSACSLAEEYYHTYRVNNKTRIKQISPLEVFSQQSANDTWTSMAQFAGFRSYYTPSSIIDMFYDTLTVEDFEEIEAAVNPNVRKDNNAGKTGINSISYDTRTYADPAGNISGYMDMAYDMIREYQLYGKSDYYSNQTGLVKVVRAYWKSYRQLGWLTTYDANDEPVVEMVDDNYQPDISKGEDVKWFPQIQVYTGAKILNTIYTDIRPYNDQIIDMDNLEYNPLPIEGCRYGTSLFDLMLPWNEMYDIIAAELREDINAAIGKAMFMSVDHIPTLPGFTMEKWYYWVKKFKIAWVKQPTKGPNTFNQFSAVDMSFAQGMVAKMEILDRIMMNCDAFAGFAPGRVAGQSTEQTLGQSSQQLSASVNQTEYLFFKHSKLIERVLNQGLNLERKSLKKNTFVHNLFDDYQQSFVDYDPDMVSNAKAGAYVTNSSEDLRKREQMHSLMQPAMQNGADFADMSELIMAETISEVRTLAHKLRRNAKAIQQATQQAKQQELQNEKDEFKSKMDTAINISKDRNKSQEKQAYIKTFGGKNASPEDDTNDDTIPDILEYEMFNLKQKDLFAKHALGSRKQVFEEKKHADQMKLDTRKLAAEKERTAMMARKKASS